MRFASIAVLLLALSACSESHELVPDASVEPPLGDGFCSAGGFCWESPRPQGNPVAAVHGAASDAYLLVGAAGLIARFDGASLHPIRSDLQDDLSAVWMSSPGDAWIGGRSGLMRWSGGARAHTVAMPVEAPVVAIHGADAAEVWVVTARSLLRWDGSALAEVAAPAGDRLRFMDVHVIARDDVWLVGWDEPGDAEPESVVFHWDGASWTERGRAFGAGYRWAVTGIARTDDGTIWATGTGVFQWTDDGAWSQVEGLWGSVLWGSGPDDLWTETGRRDTTGLYPHAEGGTVAGWGMAGSALVAGHHGSVVHLDPDAGGWRELREPLVATTVASALGRVPPTLFAGGASAAWGNEVGAVWRSARGPGRWSQVLERWDGSTWIEELTITDGMVDALHGSAADDVWAGSGARLWHRDASGWSEVALPDPSFSVESVWSLGEGRVWVAGWSAGSEGPSAVAFRHVLGGAWERFDLGPGRIAHVAARGPDDVHLVRTWATPPDYESYAALHHLDGGSFREEARWDGAHAVAALHLGEGVERVLDGVMLRERRGGVWTESTTGFAQTGGAYLWESDTGLWIASGALAVRRPE